MTGRRLVSVLSPPLVALCLALLSWEVAVRLLDVPSFLVPAPSGVIKAGYAERATLFQAAVTTFEAALAGFLLSATFGIAAGTVLSRSRLLERAFYPYALFLQTVPIVAIAPLLVLWLGAGFRAVAVAAFIVSVFPVIANTLSGLRSVDRGLRDLFRLYRATALRTLLKLELPFAVPHMVTGLRVASGLAVIGAIVGEFVAGFSEGSAGLGITVLAAYRQLRTDLLFAAVLCASALGLVLFSAVSYGGAVIVRRWGGDE